MNRLVRWLVIVGGLAAIGIVLGGLFGRALNEVSYDYIVTPADYTSFGGRMGLFVGTILAAIQTVGSRPVPTRSRVFGALALLGGISVAVVAIAGLLGPVLFSAGCLDTSGWLLPDPRRHALFLGLDRGASVGPLLGCMAAALWLWRGRGDSRGK